MENTEESKEWIYLVQSGEKCGLVGTKEEADTLVRNEPYTMFNTIPSEGALETLSAVNKEWKRIVFVHEDEAGRPFEINSRTAKIEYTMYWPDGGEERIHVPYGDLPHNPVGVILREARYVAKCIVRYYRYTFYSTAEIPRQLLIDPKSFIRLMEKEKNRERYKVFLIHETLDENCEQLYQIIYANVNLYNNVCKNSNF